MKAPLRHGNPLTDLFVRLLGRSRCAPISRTFFSIDIFDPHERVHLIRRAQKKRFLIVVVAFLITT